MTDLFYWAMVAAFFTHELDAVKRHEWRILPLLRAAPEAIGEQSFIWLHVPLFFVIVWMSREGSDGLFALCLSCFAIVHVGLHWLFRNHQANEFNTLSSWSLIGLTGLLGALHLAASLLV